MATKRPPGRPKAQHPRDIIVAVRLTFHEADQLRRWAKTDALSVAIRRCLTRTITQSSAGVGVPDTERARLARELYKAKKATSPEAETLKQLFTLEEPAADQAVDEPQAQRIVYVQTEPVPDPYAGKTFTVRVQSTKRS